MIFKQDKLTLDDMKKEINIAFRALYNMKKLVEFKEENTKQLKINAIYNMLKTKKEEIEKTSSAKKIREFHKNYVIRIKTDDKRQTLLRLDFEKLIEDSDFDFNSSVAYSILMHECSKNNVETEFLISDLNYNDEGISIDDIELEKKYIFIRDVDYKNFVFKEKSIIEFTGRLDKLGNKEISVCGLIYVKDSQGMYYITSRSFFITEPITAKLFEVLESTEVTNE